MNSQKSVSFFDIKNNDIEIFKEEIDLYKEKMLLAIEENKIQTVRDFYLYEKEVSNNFKMIEAKYAFHSTNNNSDMISDMSKEITQYSIKALSHLYHDRDYYNFIYGLETDNNQDESLKKLYLKKFEANGVNLKEEDKEMLIKSKTELNELTTRFMLNINKSKEELVYKVSDLSLLSEEDKKLFDIDTENMSFSLKFGSKLSKAISLCSSESIRKDIYDFTKTIANSGEYDNTDIVEDIVLKKKEIASILGYGSVGESVFDNNTMAKGYEEASGFVENLSRKILPIAKKEDKELLKFGKSIGVDNLDPHNIPFLENAMKNEEFSIEPYAECEFLKEQRVLEESLRLVDNIFGIKLIEENNIIEENDSLLDPHIDDNIRVYRALNENREVATVIFDLKEREGKKGGAWVSALSSPSMFDYGLIVVNANFDDKDELQFSDVKTLLHEMGHMVHHLSTKTDYAYLSGTANMSRDSVEIPSQMLEKFYLDRDFLDKVSEGKMPKDLIEKAEESKGFRVANFYARQSAIAMFDLRLYNEDIDKTIKEQYADSVNQYTARKADPESNFTNGFTHVFSGVYNSGYYGYLFSDVYSVDAYSYISKDTKKRGIEFKEKVLSKGSSENFMDLYVDFKGEKAEINSFLEYNKLLKKNGKGLSFNI